MTELPTLLSNWLYNVVQPQYANKQLTYTHLYQFLQVHYGKNLRLKIRTSVHTSPRSGQLTLLLNIFGSIPVTTNQLRVHIQLWIPLNYPFGNESASSNTNDDTSGVPMIYIVPDTSNGILIKPGNHVDSLGRFYHPFLTNWYHESTPNGSGSRKYNLLELVKVLQASFEKDCPVMVRETPGDDNAPSLPSKIPLSGDLSSPPQLHLQSTGPLLPPKPKKMISTSATEERIVPLKYQSPLPLPPNSQLMNQVNSFTPQGTGNSSFQQLSPQFIQGFSSPQESITGKFDSTTNFMTPSYLNSTLNSPTSRSPEQFHPTYNNSPRQSHTTTTAPTTTTTHYTASPQNNKPVNFDNDNQNLFIDLIDRDEGSSSVKPSDEKSDIRLLIVENISRNLNDEAKDFSFVTSNKLKIDALYQQLSYHHKQAVANSANLDSHLSYISQQKASITKLNRELAELEDANISDSSLVHISTNNSISFDSLITPDLALVNQLYDVVAEIKATKDTMDLIGGNFRSEGELIKDLNMETAVRTVRSLGREMFWLELMKNEIASIMNLS